MGLRTLEDSARPSPANPWRGNTLDGMEIEDAAMMSEDPQQVTPAVVGRVVLFILIACGVFAGIGVGLVLGIMQPTLSSSVRPFLFLGLLFVPLSNPFILHSLSHVFCSSSSSSSLSLMSLFFLCRSNLHCRSALHPAFCDWATLHHLPPVLGCGAILGASSGCVTQEV